MKVGSGSYHVGVRLIHVGIAFVCYTGSMIGFRMKGDRAVNSAMVARINPWLVVAIVAAIVLLAAAVFGVSAHALAWPWGHELACGSSIGPCD
jgi:hypothetical protein